MSSKRHRFTRMVLISLAFVIPLSSGAASTLSDHAGGAAQGDHRAGSAERSAQSAQKLAQEVRHELVLLPWYSVFDNLAFSVTGDRVTLMGQVVQPVLKDDAEKAVKGIEGVAQVVNNIEVLPLSPNDDRVRRALYRAIYGDAVLERYSLQAVPPIHIIVKYGHAVLIGVVATEMEKDLAGIRAKGVSGAFSVDNQLQVENHKS